MTTPYTAREAGDRLAKIVREMKGQQVDSTTRMCQDKISTGSAGVKEP